MRNLLIVLLWIGTVAFSGCSSAYKQEVLKDAINDEIRQETNMTRIAAVNQPAVKTVEVSAENFSVERTTIPDGERIAQVKILGAKLQDVIALLTEATDEDVVIQQQSNQIAATGGYGVGGQAQMNGQGVAIMEASDTGQTDVYVSAAQIGVGRLLNKAVGEKVSISYADGTYYLGSMRTVTVKIPALDDLVNVLRSELTTLGAFNVVHDSVTSSVTFTARGKEYLDIMNYLELLRNNLYVIEYDIAIYNVDLKDDYSLGINWDIVPTLKDELGFVSQTVGATGSTGIGTVPAMFGMVLNNAHYSGTAIVSALEHFGRVESIQRPKLLGLAGTDVFLTDGLEEPYIKSLTTTAVGDNNAQTSTVSAKALSGLKVKLNSNIMDETVITNISLEINDIVGYSDFEVDGVKYSQPKTITKTINNNMRVQPGVPIVISGLFRHKVDKGYKGIPGVAQSPARLAGGSDYRGATKSEMVIIVTPRIIKYVMK